MNKTAIAIIVGIILIGGSIFLARQEAGTKTPDAPVNNVTVVDGKQIIEINAKGGYKPRRTIAKAGLPTVIKFNTKGTFDCSASVRIPSENVNMLLPQSGSTEIELKDTKVGVVRGTCGMGMYPFEIEFQS